MRFSLQFVSYLFLYSYNLEVCALKPLLSCTVLFALFVVARSIALQLVCLAVGWLGRRHAWTVNSCSKWWRLHTELIVEYCCIGTQILTASGVLLTCVRLDLSVLFKITIVLSIYVCCFWLLYTDKLFRFIGVVELDMLLHYKILSMTQLGT